MTTKLKLTMHCASCAGNIEKALKGKVEDLNINIPLNLAKITFDETKITVNDIIDIIKGIGYDAKES